jgi:2-dehydro-3-deoxyglucarate aldolase
MGEHEVRDDVVPRMSAREIRELLRAGKATVGTWSQLPCPSVAETIARAGYDWVAVDLEHGSFATHQLPDMFRAIQAGGAVPLARVAEAHRKDIKQALDAGARGIILPMIESAEQLRAAAQACLYPPAGTRGVGFARANGFGERFVAGLAENADTLIVAQIEHVRALTELDEILAEERLDAIMVGPYDLSASLGTPGNFETSEFRSTVARIYAAARSRGVATGLHVVLPDAAVLAEALGEGHGFVAYGTDGVFLWEGARRPPCGVGGGAS